MLPEIIEKFGFDPQTVGMRYRGYELVTNARFADEYNVPLGTLVVSTRDAGLRDCDDEDYEGPIDESATQRVNFLGSETSWEDRTYRYYFFEPLK